MEDKLNYKKKFATKKQQQKELASLKLEAKVVPVQDESQANLRAENESPLP